MSRAKDTPTICDYLSSSLGREKVRYTRRLLKTNVLLRFSLLALLALFLPCTQLHAQTGLITGTVVDPSGDTWSPDPDHQSGNRRRDPQCNR